jgi:hypothetical protein
LRGRPQYQVRVSGVGGLARLRAQFGDVRRDQARVGQNYGVVHRVVRPAEVLLGGADRAGVLLAQLRHRVRRDERVLVEVENHAHHLVLALAALLLAQDQRLQDLHLLQRKKPTKLS